MSTRRVSFRSVVAAVFGICCLFSVSGARLDAADAVRMVLLGNGDQIIPPTGSSAFFAGVFRIDTVANTVEYDIVVSDVASGEQFTAIHGPAEPGQTAPSVHTTPNGKVKNGVWNYDEAQEADILASRYYLDVHTNAFPDGEIRGQICDMVCTIDGEQTFPSVGATGTGWGVFDIDTDTNMLKYHIVYDTLSSPEFAAHLHAPGGYFVNDPLPPLTLAPGPLKTGTWNYPDEHEDDLLDGRSYFLVHSNMFPGGELRGQIISSLSIIDGSQEVTPVVTDGVGYALFSIDRASNTLGFDIRTADLSSAETVAHVHGPAPAGAGAPPIFTLPTGARKLGSETVTASTIDAFLACELYVNIHTMNHGGGEIRGQLNPTPPLPLLPLEDFIRGDCNRDNSFDIADAVFMLSALFPVPGMPPVAIECDDSCDSNDDGQLNIADAVSKLAALFPPAGGPAPMIPAPHPACGPDPTEVDTLACDSYPGCP